MANALEAYLVRIERVGKSRILHIPEEFSLDAEEATITQDTQGRLIVQAAKPPPKQSLSEMLATWAPLGEEDSMPDIEDFPPEPVEF